MKILIDIIHMADVNFYKKAMLKLEKKHKIILVARPRGNLVNVLTKEIRKPDAIIGRHQKGFVSKVVEIISREVKLIRLMKKEKPDVVTCFGFYPGIAGKLLGIRSVLFHDDPEYRSQFALCRVFSSILVLPFSLGLSSDRIRLYNGYKELAYLHNFKQKTKTLRKHKLNNKYVFVREIASASLNYRKAGAVDSLPIIKWLVSNGYDVLLSLEDKRQTGRFKGYAMILKEPVNDIYSLISGADMALTSGDTVAREAALLGVPVVYTGGRIMKVNEGLVKLGAILPAIDNVASAVRKAMSKDYKKKLKARISQAKLGWADTTEVIVESLTE